MGDVTSLLTAEITHLPGLDERAWVKFAPIARQIVAKCGLGDAAADEIVADVKVRVLRCAPYSTERVPKEYVRVVSRSYMDLLAEMIVMGAEIYIVRHIDPAFRATFKDADAKL